MSQIFVLPLCQTDSVWCLRYLYCRFVKLRFSLMSEIFVLPLCQNRFSLMSQIFVLLLCQTEIQSDVSDICTATLSNWDSVWCLRYLYCYFVKLRFSLMSQICVLLLCQTEIQSDVSDICTATLSKWDLQSRFWDSCTTTLNSCMILILVSDATMSKWDSDSHVWYLLWDSMSYVGSAHYPHMFSQLASFTHTSWTHRSNSAFFHHLPPLLDCSCSFMWFLSVDVSPNTSHLNRIWVLWSGMSLHAPGRRHLEPEIGFRNPFMVSVFVHWSGVESGKAGSLQIAYSYRGQKVKQVKSRLSSTLSSSVWSQIGIIIIDWRKMSDDVDSMSSKQGGWLVCKYLEVISGTVQQLNIHR